MTTTLPERILALLGTEPGLTLPQITERLGATTRATDRALHTLWVRGAVVRDGAQRSYRYHPTPLVRATLTPVAYQWLHKRATAAGHSLDTEAAEIIERAARWSTVVEQRFEALSHHLVYQPDGPDTKAKATDEA